MSGEEGTTPERNPARTAFDILGAGLGFFAGRNQDAPGAGVSLGYQGEIPDYSLVRERVLDASDPSMRPGAAGKRYFSDYRYMPMSDPTGIAGVRQDLFNQANVGPTSLRAQNFARQGIDAANIPALGDRGPTGINTVVGDTFSYANRGINRGTTEPTTYTMADVTDPAKVQYFADGTIYIPNYGFINVNDPAALANYAQGNLPGLNRSGTDPDPSTPPPDDGSQDDGSQDDGSQDDGSQDDGSQDDGSQDDGSQDDGSQDDGSGTDTPPPNETDTALAAFGDINAEQATEVLDFMIQDAGQGEQPDFRGIPTGQESGGQWRQIANIVGYTDANGRTITTVENEGVGGVATRNDDFKLDLNGRTIYTPNKYRNVLERDRALVEDTARSLIAEGLEDQTTATIPTAITSTPTLLNYLNSLLEFEGHSLNTTPPDGAKAGGLMSLSRGGYLSGSTDGMADEISTSIEGVQPAALSDGEFVVAADVVSHLGNGNSDAGADVLYNMMADVRKARTGTPKQGTQINPNTYMPSRGIA